MKKRRLLGQHRLVDERFLLMMVDNARISQDDVVFEIGTGEGGLTELLCKKAGKVISCEVDTELYNKAMIRLSRFKNLELVLGDGFELKRRFDVLVSNIPYSRSSRFVFWLVKKKFRRAVAMVQKEFAEKLLASPGQRNYRAISVIAQAKFRIEPIANVPSDAFRPPPKVPSTIIVLEPNDSIKLDDRTILWLKRLFSFRGKKVATAVRSILKRNSSKARAEELSRPFFDKRVEELTVNEAISIASTFSKLKG